MFWLLSVHLSLSLSAVQTCRMSSNILKHLSVACFDKLIYSTVLSCLSCCVVLLSWTSSTVSYALSLSSFFLFYLALPPFSYLSPSDNPLFSHFNFCPSLPFSVSVSPSISHNTQLTHCWCNAASTEQLSECVPLVMGLNTELRAEQCLAMGWGAACSERWMEGIRDLTDKANGNKWLRGLW